MEPSFPAVWSRVTGATPGEDERAMLRRWHREAAEARQFYSVVSQRAGSPAARETLRSIGTEEERQLRRLAALYYLRTGEHLSPLPAEIVPIRPLLTVLRERYRQALERAADYRQAAEHVPEDTAELALSLAKEERDHARALLGLAERLL